MGHADLRRNFLSMEKRHRPDEEMDESVELAYSQQTAKRMRIRILPEDSHDDGNPGTNETYVDFWSRWAAKSGIYSGLFAQPSSCY